MAKKNDEMRDISVQQLADKFKEFSMPDIDPYADGNPEDDEVAENIADDGARPEKKGGADRSPRRKKSGGKKSTQVTLRLANEEVVLVRMAKLFYELETGSPVSLGVFFMEMLNHGLEHASPKAWKLYQKYAKKVDKSRGNTGQKDRVPVEDPDDDL